MEQVLALYERPYSAHRPVVCFDERPCQLLGDVVVPLPMASGKSKRQDYQYERHGVASLLMAFEPLRGWRYLQVRTRRTKVDYAHFLQQLAALYPDAEKIDLVQDNLNTHNPSSFYEAFTPAAAFALTQRFAMHYTPPHASWLNMAEIELSVFAKQCLDRRIPDIATLTHETLALMHRRNQRRAAVSWQFTVLDARHKFINFYPNQS